MQKPKKCKRCAKNVCKTKKLYLRKNKCGCVKNQNVYVWMCVCVWLCGCERENKCHKMSSSGKTRWRVLEYSFVLFFLLCHRIEIFKIMSILLQKQNKRLIYNHIQGLQLWDYTPKEFSQNNCINRLYLFHFLPIDLIKRPL